MASYGKLDKFDSHSISLLVERNKTKEVAAQILSSDLPVDDILIDEVDVQRVIRRVFNNHDKNKI